MIICQANFADFVVWTMKGIFIKRIKSNSAFFSNIADKISSFYIHVILPEVLGKWLCVCSDWDGKMTLRQCTYSMVRCA